MIRTILAACATLALATAAQADDRPVKIGLVTSFTGPGAAQAQYTAPADNDGVKTPKIPG